jgi:hypothetical protein
VQSPVKQQLEPYSKGIDFQNSEAVVQENLLRWRLLKIPLVLEQKRFLPKLKIVGYMTKPQKIKIQGKN